MATRWRWLAGVESWKQGSGVLGRERARGCGGADEGDAEVTGLPWRRGCLAGDVVWEVVAGVADEDGVLVLERRRERCQEMRANVVNAKEQRTGLGDAYVGRNGRITAASGATPVRDCCSLGARGGVRCAGNERGCRGHLIAARKEGGRGIKVRIDARRRSSP